MLFSQLVVIAAASYLMELKPPLKEAQGAEKPQQPSPYAIKALCVMLCHVCDPRPPPSRQFPPEVMVSIRGGDHWNTLFSHLWGGAVLDHMPRRRKSCR